MVWTFITAGARGRDRCKKFSTPTAILGRCIERSKRVEIESETVKMYPSPASFYSGSFLCDFDVRDAKIRVTCRTFLLRCALIFWKPPEKFVQDEFSQQKWLFMETEEAQEVVGGEVVEEAVEGSREVVPEGALEVRVLEEETQDADGEDSVVEASQFLTVHD